jgi:hypothetical protein
MQLTPIGGTIDLLGSLYEVVGYTTDAQGNPIAEIPGRYLGPDGRSRELEPRAVAEALFARPERKFRNYPLTRK